MPWKLRAYYCEDCGAWTLRNRKSNDPRVCEPCGLDRRAANLRGKDRPVDFIANSDGEVISP